jgi:hypothetical protein
MRLLKYLFFLLLGTTVAQAQTISWEYLSPLPEKVTNNAVTSVTLGDETYLYSFSGIDTTLECSGDHLRSYRYDLSTDSWETLPDLPDPNGGKIAAGASTIKDKVYVVGGYHLAPDCSETSSNRIHIFDPLTNSFLPDGANIPVAIDDQVQAVWRDSLLYVITGWSNTTNVSNVQVYNPSTNVWQQATPVGTSTVWRVFGGSGVIVGDTIYYAGGARSSGNFSATSFFRKGYINPDNPYEITWEGYTEPLALGYRMGATTFNGQPLWIGGADDTYNFDALAYNGSGVVDPLDRMVTYDPAGGVLAELVGFIPSIMDIRGVGELGDGQYLIAGGMLAGQKVTNQLLKITISDLTDVALPLSGGGELRYFPNPTTDLVQVDFSEATGSSLSWTLFDTQGRLLKMGEITTPTTWSLSLVGLPSGSYWVRFKSQDGSGEIITIQKK